MVGVQGAKSGLKVTPFQALKMDSSECTLRFCAGS